METQTHLDRKTINTSQLAKKIRLYAWISIVGGILEIIVAISALFSVYTTPNGGSIESIFEGLVNNLKSVMISSSIIGTVILIVYYRVAAEFNNLSENTSDDPESLKMAYKFLLGFILVNVIVMIVTIFEFVQIISIFNNFDIANVSEANLFELTQQIDGMEAISSIMTVIPPILELVAYYKFSNWIEIVSSRYRCTPGKDVRKTVKYILIGKGVIFAAILLGLIPGMSLGGLLSLVGLIIMLMGYFQTATILEGGFYQTLSQEGAPISQNYGFQPTSYQSSVENLSETRNLNMNQTYLNHPENLPQTSMNNSSQNQMCPMCGGPKYSDTKFCSNCGHRY